MPNILLSHNPNSFNRAAELGIELSLAGHTHGGQIQVEILDHRLSPARFITTTSPASISARFLRLPPMNAPLRTLPSLGRSALRSSPRNRPYAHVYVNRGLARSALQYVWASSEISLIVLRTA